MLVPRPFCFKIGYYFSNPRIFFFKFDDYVSSSRMFTDLDYLSSSLQMAIGWDIFKYNSSGSIAVQLI